MPIPCLGGKVEDFPYLEGLRFPRNDQKSHKAIQKRAEGIVSQLARTTALGFVVWALIQCGSVHAQGYSRAQTPLRSYRPSPTLSPYLDYFRAPQGPLDSYHEYVRPKLNLQRTLNQQDRQLRVQSREIGALSTQWTDAQRNTTIAPTGTGAGFFNYSHFYPSLR